MATRIRKTAEEIEDRITGGEPNFKDKIISNGEMAQALNWFSQNRDNKASLKYLGEYLKKNKIKVSSEIINKQKPTFGFLCRLKNTGSRFNDLHEISFQKMLKEMLEQIEPPEVKKIIKTNVVSIQDRVAEKVSEIIGDIEGAIDDYILGGFNKPTVPYALMHGRAKNMHAVKIMEFFKNRRSEFAEVLTTKDDTLREGYSNFTKTQLKKLVAYCDQIILDCTKISGESKVGRKPRKRKAKSPDQLISKLNFLNEDDTYKVKSVSPTQIIGALQLWVFNVKTRKLGIYNSSDAGGLSVKGSSIVNFDEETSIQKTLRKPGEILPEVIKGGKVFMRTVLANINSVETNLTGRINKETILLRVIK
jgi:hypothetical protein